MTPRLAVTREQAESMLPLCGFTHGGTWACITGDDPCQHNTVTLRLPERPTMPCPECNGSGRRLFMSDVMDCTCGSGLSRGPGVVPIPEGTRVEVGWWERCDCWDGVSAITNGCSGWKWHPVATATIASVELSSDVNRSDPASRERSPWVVTLTDVEAM